MRHIYLSRMLCAGIICLLSGPLAAQVSGLKHIPGDYPTLAAAVGALNIQGVGPTGATLEVSRNYVETTTNLTLTARGTANGLLVLRAAAGMGLAPRLTGGNGTGSTDALLKLVDCDYVQIEGFDFVPLVQSTPTTRVEWGLALLKSNGSNGVNGCQHVDVTACSATMPLNDSETSGIYVANHTATSLQELVPTTAAGTNSFIHIANNRLIGGSHGIAVLGYVPPSFGSTAHLVDTNNAITGNTVTGFNQLTPFLSSPIIRGIYGLSQRNLTVDDNAVSTNLTGVSSIEGIWVQRIGGRWASLCRNSVFLRSRGSNFRIGGFIFGSGAVYTRLTDNRCALDAESVFNGPQGVQYLDAFTVGGRRIDALRNLVTGCITTGTGRLASFMGLHIGVGDSSVVAYNRVQGLTLPTTVHVEAMFVAASNTTTNVLVERNTIASITASGDIYGIHNYYGDEITIARNRIGNLSSSFAGNAQPAVQGIYTFSNININIQNNLIGQLRAPASSSLNGVVGVNADGGFRRRIYHNTVYLDAASTATAFGSTALYTPGPGEVDIRNNILLNRSTPAGAGITVAWRNNLGNPFTTNLATDYNILYAGTPGPNRMLYADQGRPADNRTTLAALQGLWAPRNAHSITENTPLASLSILDASFLHLAANNQSLAESGGQVIAGFRHDCDTLNSRPLIYPIAGQVNGGGTGPDIGADEGDYRRGTPVVSATAVAADRPSFDAYPQPFTATLQLILAGSAGPLPVALTDALGRVVLRTVGQPVGVGQWQLAGLQHLPAGTYVVQLTLPDGQQLNRRIFKE